jgi:hypothetical protein
MDVDRIDGRRRQDLRSDAERALRPGAGIDRQDLLERAVHHAEADVAETDPFEQITDYTGSGPFVFEARTSGCRARRSSTRSSPTTCRAPSRPPPPPAARSPRSTASSGLYFPDQTTAMNALINGEVDYFEQPGERPDADPRAQPRHRLSRSTTRSAISASRASTTCCRRSTTPRCAGRCSWR